MTSSHAQADNPGSPLQRLIETAIAARENAVAPYSRFRVGAALETTTGEMIGGCNIENATYGLTVCAERVALFRAIAQGQRHFRRIVIVAETEEPTPPCGACRQVLWEFGGDLEVILAHPLTRQVSAVHRLSQLLPCAFDSRFLTAKAEEK